MENDENRDYTQLFCISCGKGATDIGIEESNITEVKLCDGGLIDTINAGYGSVHDGDVYHISICDECTSKALEDGRLVYKSNYMLMEPNNEELKKWDDGYNRRLRENNIDDLLKE